MKKPKPKAKKPARARAARPAPAPDAEDPTKLARIFFPYEEPTWPGTTPKWPKPAPLFEIVAEAQNTITNGMHANNRAADATAIAMVGKAARDLCRWLAATAANGEADESKMAQAMTTSR